MYISLFIFTLCLLLALSHSSRPDHYLFHNVSLYIKISNKPTHNTNTTLTMGYTVFGWLFPSQFPTLQLDQAEQCIFHFQKFKYQVAAAAAKSLQSCPTLCDPRDGSPPGSAVPGILQARTLEWVAISFSNAWKWEVKGKSLSRVRLFATPWTAAHQVPPSMGFSRQEYWSGVPLPSPWDYTRYYLLVVGRN